MLKITHSFHIVFFQRMLNKYSAAALMLFASFASAQAQDASRIANKFVGSDGQPEFIQFSAEGKAALRCSLLCQIRCCAVGED